MGSSFKNAGIFWSTEEKRDIVRCSYLQILQTGGHFDGFLAERDSLQKLIPVLLK